MNKTVNINLAGIFFHIDEDAYLKLQRYLEAIKRSFTDSQGRSEIISDIEARIAELFNERVENNKQVIGIKQVDEVISIMGQPEDYLVDDEIFEDEPTTTRRPKSAPSKKLFRDADNSYIGGVSSGLGHYFGIDAIWIRLAWIILIFGAGTGVLLYILLWILVPEAKTTAEKIMMTGEPVNISNIEKKIKDGLGNVTETVSDVAKNVSDTVSDAAKNVSDAAKNVDFKKQTNKVKSSSSAFFDTIGEIFMFFFKIFAKFIGVLLIFIGAVTLISLIVGLLSVGVVDIIRIPGIDFVEIANAGNTPIWVVSLLTLFAVGIPFFFLFYLGLKILINNLKSIGNAAKFTLLGVWLIAVVGLFVVGIREASAHAFDETFSEKTELNIKANDSLRIKMVSNDIMHHNYYRNHAFKVASNENGEKTIYNSDIRLIIRSTTDSVASLNVKKNADGRDYQEAIDRAKNINYNYSLDNGTLYLDAFLSTAAENKFSDQELDLILYLPEGTVANFHNNTRSFLGYHKSSNDIVSGNDTGKLLLIVEEDIECLDCPEEDSFKVDVDVHDESSKVKIDDEGIEIKGDDVEIKIDNNGIRSESEEVKVKIDSDGVEIKSKDN
ncbi:PspC domain-containing protein [Seonamhaeicola marinus]|uniref:PspC domain-containing protein n=1 Tax=Seonamhaeicola marinus TaxID=1912246 RepID=A0A5D0IM83_9FLAO|nr:PspC domain-containing protein [Seonamhaeicola marinus]TYA84288.1 PspC domain-containing protein [Seonamhaeicola marinus]